MCTYKTLANGDLWSGDLLNGKPHGIGCYISQKPATAGKKYEGEYRNGHRVGKGKITWPDGDIYEGEWNDEGKHGYGKMQYIYAYTEEGEYENNHRIGKGKITWPNGEIYEGEWSDLGKHGYGKLQGTSGNPNNDIYEEYFWEGIWNENRFIKGISYSNIDGVRHYGTYDNGQLIHEKIIFTDGNVCEKEYVPANRQKINE